ncbi:hypothetical protein HY627_02570 [Candidatus Uhrbacteria bacterium]|nr:hypothetical protein [Candidatus Uhrbacteria bacterium]
MFEIKSGMTRTALLVGSIVFKFPSVKSWRGFWTGVIANISEFAIWYCVRGKATFLAPTLFTLGIVNVQLRVRGQMVLGQELKLRFKLLDIEAQNLIPQLGGHALHPANWVKNKKGYRLVDYGDTFISEYIQLSGFIWMFHDQLSPILLADLDESRLSEAARNTLGYQRLLEDQEWLHANDGMHVAICDGKLVAQADSQTLLCKKLKALGVAQQTLVAQVGEDDEKEVRV